MRELNVLYAIYNFFKKDLVFRNFIRGCVGVFAEAMMKHRIVELLHQMRDLASKFIDEDERRKSK
jgi:hypothetical protein